MNDSGQAIFPVRVATLEVLGIEGRPLQSSELAPAYKNHCRYYVSIEIKPPEIGAVANAGENSQTEQFSAEGDSLEQAVSGAVQHLCLGSFSILHLEKRCSDDGQYSCLVTIDNEKTGEQRRAGLGRAIAPDETTAVALAVIRAANHAGLLARDYRANNQKLLREWARETATQISQLSTETESKSSSTSIQQPSELSLLLTESLLLEAFNKVASAAVITATNHPRPETILSLFDTSVWLFDSNGQRRDSYTDTGLWLAWYPGVNNDEETVQQVIESMPAAPETAIPWIVRLFENPSSRLRFRGAVDLEDHDVLHVLLGRGLQDQDEAFVLGFAMGTAKSISSIETAVFKFILTRLYPEPYRIPTFLRPAFDLGVQCGRQTGHKNLYKHDLKRLLQLSLGEARRKAGIDMDIVKRFYQLEQELIPYTIASLRLP